MSYVLKYLQEQFFYFFEESFRLKFLGLKDICFERKNVDNFLLNLSELLIH